jgi:chromatin remodeling complex protein RSC6
MISRSDVRALEQLTVPPPFGESNDSDSDSDEPYAYSNPFSNFEFRYPVNPLLVEFIGLEPGTRVARSEAQRAIRMYIQINNLANPDRRSIVNLDQTLKTLLRSEGPFSYPEIVRGMQWLFPTKEEAALVRIV